MKDSLRKVKPELILALVKAQDERQPGTVIARLNRLINDLEYLQQLAK